MITTITTSTITTVTAVIGFGVILGLVAIVALVVFLGAKELTAVSSSDSHRFLTKFLDVGIIPLTIAFAIIVIMKIVEIVS